jgi:hypothetical protein
MTRLTEAQWHRLITLLDEQEARVRRQVGALEPEGPDADAMSTAEPYEEVDLADQEATERASDVMLEHYRAELVQIGATRARNCTCGCAATYAGRRAGLHAKAEMSAVQDDGVGFSQLEQRAGHVFNGAAVGF